MQKILLYVLLTFTVVPSILHSATVAAPSNFKGLVAIITNIISTLILFVFALTFLAFMWGVVKGWIVGGGETEGVESGKKVVFAGIIALVIMSSIWGILYLLQSSLLG